MDILTVVSEFERLIPRGKAWVGTSKDMESFTVYPEQDSWYHFSQSIGGDIVRYLMVYQNYTYVEAMEYLGISDNNALLSLSPLVRQTYDQAEMPRGQIDVNNAYLLSRGLTSKTIEKYKIESTPTSALVPLYNVEGRRIGSFERKHSNDVQMPYLTHLVENKPALWPLTVLKEQSPDVIIIVVESAWSSLLLNQAIEFEQYQDKFLCMAALTNNFSSIADKLLYGRTVVGIGDPDDGGKSFNNKVANRRHGPSYVLELTNVVQLDEMNIEQLSLVIDTVSKIDFVQANNVLKL